MTQKLIQLIDISLQFPGKLCFDGINADIHYGDRIALIGNNGCGKSSLLQLIQGQLAPTEGEIKHFSELSINHVPQLIVEHDALSGGERFNAALSAALATWPEVLLLDEPTNHLDAHNRRSLMRMLSHYTGTLIIVTHDVELIRQCTDTLWHIDHSQLSIFNGNYDDYQQMREQHVASLEKSLAELKREKDRTHQRLMREQSRAKTSKARGKKHIAQRKWPTVRSATKMGRANLTAVNNQQAIAAKREAIAGKLDDIRLPEVISPTFQINNAHSSGKLLVSISNGSIAYDTPVLCDINLTIHGGDRIALLGDNGSGKSSVIKALMSKSIRRGGDWLCPSAHHIGYLDQHYATLDATLSVFDNAKQLVPSMEDKALRSHLSTFLFRTHDDVNTLGSQLSGGERARLSLAIIALQAPPLLILDEITNNLDLETRQHVIDVLNAYPGAILCISHDTDFLNDIKVERFYTIKDGTLLLG